MVIVSNTTPIISLTKAGILDLLGKLYGKIFIPKVNHDELTSNNTFIDEANIIKSCNFL